MDAISRRKFFGFGLGAAAAGVAPLSLTQLARALPASPAAGPNGENTYVGSIEKALQFQNTMMDATPRAARCA